MRESTMAEMNIAPNWQMPISPEQYDRRNILTEEEQAALVEVVALAPQKHLLLPSRLSTQVLIRLTRPLRDIYNLSHTSSQSSLNFGEG